MSAGAPATPETGDARPRAPLARRLRGPLAVVVLLGLLAVLFGPRLVLGPQVPVVTVVRHDFVQSVVASGHVEAPHRVEIGTQVAGTVQRIPVAEGQSVDAGQVLIELDPAEARAVLAQATTAVAQAEAHLRQLDELQVPLAEQAQRQARATLDNARSQLQRQQDLFRQGFVGQAALDDALRAVEVADAQWRSAVEQQRTLGPQGSDRALAQTALAQARAAADAARARLGYTTVRAPVAGVLISRDVEPGNVVQPGKALMVLSPAGETQLVVQIDEKNLGLLALGQKALASADAFPDRRFEAELVYINPGVDAQRGSVEVKLRVPKPPPFLRQDMTVSVDIEVGRRPQALLLPAGTLRDANGAHPWVLRVEDGRARRREVTPGLRGGGFEEVREGLAAGDRVVAASANGVHEGSRLRPLPAAP